MTWVWIALGLWAIALVVRGLRRRPPATYAPMPPLTDTTTGMADRTRSERLSEPYDWTTDDGPDAA